MSTDKNVSEHLSYLDSILDFLVIECSLQVSCILNALYNHLHKDGSRFDDNFDAVSYLDILSDKPLKVSLSTDKNKLQKRKISWSLLLSTQIRFDSNESFHLLLRLLLKVFLNI